MTKAVDQGGRAPRSRDSTRRISAPPARRILSGALLMVGAGALLAACSSPNHPSAGGSTSNTSHGETTTTTTQATPTTLPVPPTSGPLSISATVAVPIPANVQITAAEGPNGAVFVAQENQDSTATTVVWVIDPTGPAAVAETVNGGVSALAADPTNLYVVSNDSVIGYTRSTGNQMGQWKLPPINTANTSNADLVSMVAANGQVLVMIAQGNLQDVYRINPNATTAPKMIAQGTSAAIGPDGSVYYERSDDHLIKVTATGVITVGPPLADSPNGEGGGIAGVEAVAGGLVWVSEPAGQGLDTELTPYDAATLQAMGKYAGSVTEQIVDTSAGPLVLVGPNGPGDCPQGTSAISTSCVFRISPSAVLSYPTTVGVADQLLGPDPAVITATASGTDLMMDRLN